MSIDQSLTHPGEDEKHHAEASDTGTQPDYEEGRPPATSDGGLSRWGLQS